MLADYTRVIDQAAAHVPALLWPPEAYRAMRSLVRRFPSVRMKTIGPVRLGIIGLELRLSAGDAPVDLTFPILREDRGVIVAMGEDEADGAWMRGDPAWSRILGFCRRWADPETAVGRHAELLWFELDVDGREAEGIPVPGVFVGFRPESTPLLDGAAWRAILSDVLRELTGEPARESILDHFEGAVRALPRGGYVRFFGLMLSRGGGTVRFVMEGIPPGEIPGFLESIGWPGSAAALAAAVDGLSVVDGRRVHPGPGAVQYDVAGGVLPRIGLECPLDRDAQAEGRVEEQEFLQLLVEHGLLDAEKRDALLELPGRTMAPYDDICMLGHARQLHHVKLVVDGGAVREAKAYYGRSLVVLPIPRPPAERAAASGPQPAR